MEFDDSISDGSTVRSFSSNGFSDGMESKGTLSGPSVHSNQHISKEKQVTLKRKTERDADSEPLAKKPVSVLDFFDYLTFK